MYQSILKIFFALVVSHYRLHRTLLAYVLLILSMPSRLYLNCLDFPVCLSVVSDDC